MAKRASFAIGPESVEPGHRRTVDLPVSVLSDHTPVTMSAHVIHGSRAGPCMFITAGVHGDEVIGVEIVRRLLAVSSLQRLRGTLIVVPIVNTFGFLNHSRYLPDRRDLNRSFPGSARGSLAARLADLLMQEIVGRADMGIDLHSAAVHRTNLPQIRISPGNAGLARLARAFGAPVILHAKERPGSLRAAAKAAGVELLLYEAGEGLRFDELGVRAGVKGILRVMHECGMIGRRGATPAKKQPVHIQSSQWLRAPQGGLLRVYKETGALAAKGDVLATVSDPFGEVEREVRAPNEGIIIGRAVMPVVNEGDALFHLATVTSSAHAATAVESLSSELEADPLFDEDEIV